MDAAFVKAVRDRIDRREAEEAAGAIDEAKVVAMLLRAAHLTITVDAMGLSYSAWVKASLTGDRRHTTVQRMADRLAGAFTAPANVEMDGFSANGTPNPRHGRGDQCERAGSRGGDRRRDGAQSALPTCPDRRL